MPVIGFAYSESTIIPEWIKDTARFWADGDITDQEFVKALEFMIANEIITLPKIEQLEQAVKVPTEHPNIDKDPEIDYEAEYIKTDKAEYTVDDIIIVTGYIDPQPSVSIDGSLVYEKEYFEILLQHVDGNTRVAGIRCHTSNYNISHEDKYHGLDPMIFYKIDDDYRLTDEPCIDSKGNILPMELIIDGNYLPGYYEIMLFHTKGLIVDTIQILIE